jgi:hypothetical protein
MPTPTVPDDVRESIRILVDYLWYDHEEERHWLESGQPDGHIFRYVKYVAAWLDAQRD